MTSGFIILCSSMRETFCEGLCEISIQIVFFPLPYVMITFTQSLMDFLPHDTARGLCNQLPIELHEDTPLMKSMMQPIKKLLLLLANFYARSTINWCRFNVYEQALLQDRVHKTRHTSLDLNPRFFSLPKFKTMCFQSN